MTVILVIFIAIVVLFLLGVVLNILLEGVKKEFSRPIIKEIDNMIKSNQKLQQTNFIIHISSYKTKKI